MENAVLKVNDFGLKNEVEKLFIKVKQLVDKLHDVKEENKHFKEKVRDLEQELSEMKIAFSNKNSEILGKDKEMSELKNKLLDERKNRISSEDKTMLKNRIRELMIRLDSHLEQKANNNF